MLMRHQNQVKPLGTKVAGFNFDEVIAIIKVNEDEHNFYFVQSHLFAEKKNEIGGCSCNKSVCCVQSTSHRIPLRWLL